MAKKRGRFCVGQVVYDNREGDYLRIIRILKSGIIWLLLKKKGGKCTALAKNLRPLTLRERGMKTCTEARNKFEVGDCVRLTAEGEEQQIAKQGNIGMVVGFNRNHPELVRIRVGDNISCDNYHMDFWEVKHD